MTTDITADECRSARGELVRVLGILDPNETFVEDMTVPTLVGYLDEAADRLEADAARERFVEELAHVLTAAAVPVANDMHRFYRREARAAIDHLQPITEWLAAEKVWEATRLARPVDVLPGDDSPWSIAPLGIACGPVRSIVAAIEGRLNKLLGDDGYRVSIALDEPPPPGTCGEIDTADPARPWACTLPAEHNCAHEALTTGGRVRRRWGRSWPSLDQVPHGVTEVRGADGEVWEWVDGGWRYHGIGPAWSPLWGGTTTQELAPFVEVLDGAE
ncbi:hypothetical protein ACWFRB_09375 [Rhodococcus sp. NPDC055112]